MKYYDIIFTVIASRGEIYDLLINNYWYNFIEFLNNNKHTYNIKIIMMFGKDTKLEGIKINKENIFISQYEDSLIPGIFEKTIDCFKYIEQNFTYKHIIRSNLSSFYIIDNLIKIHKLLDVEKIYAGRLGIHENIIFCSGCGFWISKDYVNILINNFSNIEKNKYPDDVIIAKILKKYNKIKLQRFDIIHNSKINDNEKKILIDNLINNNIFHIRIKNKDRKIDIDYMNYFTNYLYNNTKKI